MNHRYYLFLLVLLSISSAFGWWDTDYTYKKAIIIDHNLIDSTLTDYPLLVYLNSSNFNFSRTLSNGYDVRFVAADDSSSLTFERVSYSQADQKAEFWVKIPSVSSSNDTVVYLYYGYDSASDASDADNTWDSNYVGVYHFEANGADSSGTGNTLTASGATLKTDGLCAVGNCYYFDDSNDGLGAATFTGLAASDGGRTFEVWANASSTSNTHRNLIDTEELGYMYLRFDAGGYYQTQVLAGSWVYAKQPLSALSINNWYSQASVYSRAVSLALYSNGTLLASTALGNNNLGTASSQTFQLSVGCTNAGVSDWEWFGRIDEVRVSNINRTAGYLNANNYAMRLSLCSYGVEDKFLMTEVTLTQPTNTTYYDYFPTNTTFKVTGGDSSYTCTFNVNGNITAKASITNNTTTYYGIKGVYGSNSISINCGGTLGNNTASQYWTTSETPPTITYTHPTNTTYYNLVTNTTFKVTGPRTSYPCELTVNSNNTNIGNITNNSLTVYGINSQWQQVNLVSLTCAGVNSSTTTSVYYTQTDPLPLISISTPLNTTYWFTKPNVTTFTVSGIRSTYDCEVEVNGNSSSTFTVTQGVATNYSLNPVAGLNIINVSCTSIVAINHSTNYFTEFSHNTTSQDNPITISGGNYTYKLFFNFNPSLINLTSLLGNITINSTDYQADSIVYSSINATITKQITMPYLTGFTELNTSLPVSWAYNYTHLNNTIGYGTQSGGTTTVYQLFFDDSCTIGVETLNISLFDESTYTSTVNGSVNINLTFNDFPYNLTSTKTGNSSYVYCVYPAFINESTNMSIIYSNLSVTPVYAAKNYYWYNTLLSNSSTNLNLYLLSNSGGYAGILNFIVAYRSGMPVIGAIVQLERNYGYGSTSIVSMSQPTDNNGGASIYIDFINALYSITVTLNGQQLTHLTSRAFSTSDNPYIIYVDDALSGYIDRPFLSTSYNNDTKVFNISISSPVGTLESTELIVIRSNNYATSSICDTNITGVSGAAYCNLSGYITDTSTFNYYIYVTDNYRTYLLAQGFIDENLISNGEYGSMAPFLLFVLVLISALVGSRVSAQMTLLMSAVGLLFGTLLFANSLFFATMPVAVIMIISIILIRVGGD